MPIEKVSDRKRQNAVAKILAGESNAATEAQRLNVSKRSVERWVEAARAAGPVADPVVPDAVSSSVVPPEEGASDRPNQALEDALKAAGESPDKPATAPPGAAAVADARLDMAAYCLDAIAQFKQAVGGVLVTFRYTPPLDLAAADVQKVLAVGPMAQLAVRSNAEKLYPTLVKVMSGPGVIYAALAMDALLMIVGLEALAKRSGWKAPAKGDPAAGMKPARGGSPMDLAEQIERARKEQEPQPLAGGLPVTSTPTQGTINAPAA
jgi:hypothetical protein